jgi:hypothetical protein
MRSGSVENTYASSHGGGVGGPVEADVGAKRIGGLEPERPLRFSPRPPHAAARGVQEERTEKRRSSEPGVERRGHRCSGSSMEIAVGN